MHPADHISIDVSYFSYPSNSSGALYHNVTTKLVYGLRGKPNLRANPKSHNFNIPLFEYNKLDVFRSL